MDTESPRFTLHVSTMFLAHSLICFFTGAMIV
jgi:hypothetical protein